MPLRALEQDSLSGLADAVEGLPYGVGEGQHFRRHFREFGHERVGIHFRHSETPEQRIVVQQQGGHLAGIEVLVREIAKADRPAGHLVLIGGADAATGRPDPSVSQRHLPDLVEIAVQRQNEGNVFGDANIVGADLDPLPLQHVDLRQQCPWIEDDTVADDGQFAPTDHSRRQQAQLVGHAVDDEGMSRVVAPLKADHHVGAFRKPVDDLAFSLVAPLRTDNYYIGHCALFLGSKPNH